jgi:hypothetical protein
MSYNPFGEGSEALHNYLLAIAHADISVKKKVFRALKKKDEVSKQPLYSKWRHAPFVLACFRWIRTSCRSGPIYSWRHNFGKAESPWHCAGVVREYLIGRLPLRPSATPLLLLACAHVDEYVASTCFKAWRLLAMGRRRKLIAARCILSLAAGHKLQRAMCRWRVKCRFSRLCAMALRPGRLRAMSDAVKYSRRRHLRRHAAEMFAPKRDRRLLHTCFKGWILSANELAYRRHMGHMLLRWRRAAHWAACQRKIAYEKRISTVKRTFYWWREQGELATASANERAEFCRRSLLLKAGVRALTEFRSRQATLKSMQCECTPAIMQRRTLRLSTHTWHRQARHLSKVRRLPLFGAFLSIRRWRGWVQKHLITKELNKRASHALRFSYLRIFAKMCELRCSQRKFVCRLKEDTSVVGNVVLVLRRAFRHWERKARSNIQDRVRRQHVLDQWEQWCSNSALRDLLSSWAADAACRGVAVMHRASKQLLAIQASIRHWRLLSPHLAREEQLLSAARHRVRLGSLKRGLKRWKARVKRAVTQAHLLQHADWQRQRRQLLNWNARSVKSALQRHDMLVGMTLYKINGTALGIRKWTAFAQCQSVPRLWREASCRQLAIRSWLGTAHRQMLQRTSTEKGAVAGASYSRWRGFQIWRASQCRSRRAQAGRDIVAALHRSRVQADCFLLWSRALKLKGAAEVVTARTQQRQRTILLRSTFEQWHTLLLCGSMARQNLKRKLLQDWISFTRDSRLMLHGTDWANAQSIRRGIQVWLRRVALHRRHVAQICRGKRGRGLIKSWMVMGWWTARSHQHAVYKSLARMADLHRCRHAIKQLRAHILRCGRKRAIEAGINCIRAAHQAKCLSCWHDRAFSQGCCRHAQSACRLSLLGRGIRNWVARTESSKRYAQREVARRSGILSFRNGMIRAALWHWETIANTLRTGRLVHQILVRTKLISALRLWKEAASLQSSVLALADAAREQLVVSRAVILLRRWTERAHLNVHLPLVSLHARSVSLCGKAIQGLDTWRLHSRLFAIRTQDRSRKLTQSFNHWHMGASMAAATTRFSNDLLSKRCQAAFRSWRGVLVHMHLLRTVHEHYLTVGCEKALTVWRERSRHMHQIATQAANMLLSPAKAMNEAYRRRAWDQWREWNSQRVLRKSRLLSHSSKHSSRLRSVCVRAWHSKCRVRKSTKRGGNMIPRSLAHCIVAWRKYVGTNQSKYRNLQKANAFVHGKEVRAIRKALCLLMFMRWQAESSLSRQRVALRRWARLASIKRALRALMTETRLNLLRSSFTTLQKMSAALIRQRMLMKKRVSLHAWAARISQRKALVRTLAAALHMQSHSVQRRAFLALRARFRKRTSASVVIIAMERHIICRVAIARWRNAIEREDAFLASWAAWKSYVHKRVGASLLSAHILRSGLRQWIAAVTASREAEIHAMQVRDHAAARRCLVVWRAASLSVLGRSERMQLAVSFLPVTRLRLWASRTHSSLIEKRLNLYRGRLSDPFVQRNLCIRGLRGWRLRAQRLLAAKEAREAADALDISMTLRRNFFAWKSYTVSVNMKEYSDDWGNATLLLTSVSTTTMLRSPTSSSDTSSTSSSSSSFDPILPSSARSQVREQGRARTTPFMYSALKRNLRL